MQKTSLNGIFMVLAAAMLWGTTGTAQTFAPAQLSPYWVGALRLLVAGAFFAAYTCLTKRTANLTDQSAGISRRWVLLAGACIALYNLTFFAGVKAAGVAIGTAIAIGSGPIWAGLLQALTSGEAPGRTWWAGTLLAVAGGCLMIMSEGERLYGSPIGIGLCLAAGLLYAAYALVNKRLISRHPPALVTLYVFTTATAIALPVAVVLSGGFAATPAGWTVVLYLGVITTGIAYLLFSSGLRHISGATAVSLALMEPLTAFLLGIAVVSERPAASAFLGMGLVLAGLATVIWAEVQT
jgi:DME family drug/metabolite transporter